MQNVVKIKTVRYLLKYLFKLQMLKINRFLYEISQAAHNIFVPKGKQYQNGTGVELQLK